MSNCITDDIKTCSNNGLGPKLVYLFVYNFPLILNVFINIHGYANYIICICNYLMKGLSLSLSFVTKVRDLG